MIANLDLIIANPQCTDKAIYPAVEKVVITTADIKILHLFTNDFGLMITKTITKIKLTQKPVAHGICQSSKNLKS